MSDNEDLLADDLGDTLHEYSLGNEDEDLLLAGDEYVFDDKNNVQSGTNYVDEDNLLDEEISGNNYATSVNNDQISGNIYEDISIVENITVEVKNQTVVCENTDVRQRRRSSSSNAGEVLAAKPIGKEDINTGTLNAVPSDIQPHRDIVDSGKGRLEVRFHSEKPIVALKTPQVRNIPDSLDQVYIPGARGLGIRPSRPPRQTSWRNPHYQQPARTTTTTNLYKKVIHNTGPVLPSPQIQQTVPPTQDQPILPSTQQIQRPIITNPPEIKLQISPPRPNLPEIHKNETNFTQTNSPHNAPHNVPHPQIYNNEPPQFTINQMPPQLRREFEPRNNIPLPQNTVIMNRMPPLQNIRPNIPQVTFQNPQVRPYYPGPQVQIRPQFQNVQYQRFPPPPYGQPPPYNQMALRGLSMGPRGPNIVPSGPNMGPRGPNMGPRGPNMGPRGPMQQTMGQVRPMPPIVRHVIPNNAPNPNLGSLPMKNLFGRPNLSMDGPPGVDSCEFGGPLREQEVRMIPLQQIGVSVPPVSLSGKKVHINPHFKGNIQPRIDGPPTYVPTRIDRPPSPLPPYGGGRGTADVEDAAERFIAEQRSALAKAAARKLHARRSPQRYIDNTTIEIENELAGPEMTANPPPPGDEDQDLLRRQEEFISANRAGLRRRMQSPSPPPPRRRSHSPPPAPRRRPPAPFGPSAHPPPPTYKRRREADTTQPDPEESEYRRKLREQENLRERVLRAKEARRRKNAVVLQKQIDDREREKLEKDRQEIKEADIKQNQNQTRKPSPTPQLNNKTDQKDNTGGNSPTAADKEELTNKTVPQIQTQSETKEAVKQTQERRHKLPQQQQQQQEQVDSEVKASVSVSVSGGTEESLYDDDALDLFLQELDGNMSEDETTEESGRFKLNQKTAVKSTKPISDLRSKLPPRAQTDSTQEQNKGHASRDRKKIVFHNKPREESNKNEEVQTQNVAQKRKATANTVSVSTSTSHPSSTDRSLTPPFDERQFTKQGKMRTQLENNAPKSDVESNQTRPKFDRQRITFGNKQVNDNLVTAAKPVRGTSSATSSGGFSNRRVVLQRSTNKTEEKPQVVETRLEKLSKTNVFQRIDNNSSESNVSRDPTKPTAGIFSRAMRTTFGPSTSQTNASNRLVVKKRKEVTPEPITADEPKVEFASDSSDDDLDSLNEELLLRDEDEDILNEEMTKIEQKKNVAQRKNTVSERKHVVRDRKKDVTEQKKVESDRFSVNVENLPYGMTETRLWTLAGNDVQSVSINTEGRSARLEYRDNFAAKMFVKKFNNKMVAASRLSVTML